MKDLKDFLQTQITKWKGILNTHYKTDEGSTLEEYAKGKLEAYIQTLTYINEQEKKNGKLEKETRRIRKEVLTNDGSTQQESVHIK